MRRAPPPERPPPDRLPPDRLPPERPPPSQLAESLPRRVEVHFVAPDLRRLDALKCEALATWLFEDERPPRGVLGLVDFRLCGLVSRLAAAGKVRGTVGERLLVAARPKLPFDKLLVLGAGPRDAFDEALFGRLVRDLLSTLEGARVRASVLELPGRSLGRVAPARAAERFLELAQLHGAQDEVTLVEDPEAQRLMAPVVERVRRRARASVP